MYSLSIFFGPSPVPAQFLFKEKETAERIASCIQTNKAKNDGTWFKDDYGQEATICLPIHAVILEDMDLGEESRIQRGLSQARGQANANKRAQSDPVLLAANRAQGPSVLTPFGNGGFGRN